VLAPYFSKHQEFGSWGDYEIMLPRQAVFFESDAEMMERDYVNQTGLTAIE